MNDPPVKNVASSTDNQAVPSPAAVRDIVKEHGRLAVDVETLADDASLYEAGMTSHASVNVMLALEDTFDVEFPDEMLTRSVFESVASISAALAQLEAQAV